MEKWQLQDAKARLSELVKSAGSDGPQEITVRGEPAVVVVSRAEYERLRSPRPSFVDLIRRSPMTGAKLRIDRDKSLTREVAI